MPYNTRLEPLKESLTGPTDVAVDTFENIYVSESSTNRIIVFDSKGRHIKTIRGLADPLRITISTDGKIYVGNKGRGNVEVYDNNSLLLFKLGAGDGEFDHPNGIALDKTGTAYVADSGENKIKVYDPEGNGLFSFGSGGNKDGQLNFPISISINEESEELIITDLPLLESESGTYMGARIQIFDKKGVFKKGFGSYGLGKELLTRPIGIALDQKNRIYISDSYQNVIKVFDHNGTYLGIISDSSSILRTPLGIAFSKTTNRLFVASLNTGKVEVFAIDIRMIDASSGPGGITSPSGSIYVKLGTNQSFTFKPEKDYHVAEVLVDGLPVGRFENYTFRNVTKHHTIKAIFEPIPIEQRYGGMSGPIQKGFFSYAKSTVLKFKSGFLLLSLLLLYGISKRRRADN